MGVSLQSSPCHPLKNLAVIFHSLGYPGLKKMVDKYFDTRNPVQSNKNNINNNSHLSSGLFDVPGSASHLIHVFLLISLYSNARV